MQQAVEKELNQAKLDSLLHLIPSDLSSLPSWLPATIFPFLLVHRPHQMVSKYDLWLCDYYFHYFAERVSWGTEHHFVLPGAD